MNDDNFPFSIGRHVGSGAPDDNEFIRVQTSQPLGTLTPSPIVGDLDGDERVGGTDLGLLLGQWGGTGTGDLDGDSVVGSADLGILLGAWTGS